MAIQWSGLSPELLLRLDRGSGQPLRSQLETSLREAIRSGLLADGERLPSSRELARELGVSRGLVQECYGQLLSEGYLTSQGGSEISVAESGSSGHPEASEIRGVASNENCSVWVNSSVLPLPKMIAIIPVFWSMVRPNFACTWTRGIE